jgi:hypothetical protein
MGLKWCGDACRSADADPIQPSSRAVMLRFVRTRVLLRFVNPWADDCMHRVNREILLGLVSRSG